MLQAALCHFAFTMEAGRSISNVFISAGRANHFKGRDLHAHRAGLATESYIKVGKLGLPSESVTSARENITVPCLYTANTCLLL